MEKILHNLLVPFNALSSKLMKKWFIVNEAASMLNNKIV